VRGTLSVSRAVDQIRNPLILQNYAALDSRRVPLTRPCSARSTSPRERGEVTRGDRVAICDRPALTGEGATWSALGLHLICLVGALSTPLERARETNLGTSRGAVRPWVEPMSGRTGERGKRVIAVARALARISANNDVTSRARRHAIGGPQGINQERSGGQRRVARSLRVGKIVRAIAHRKMGVNALLARITAALAIFAHPTQLYTLTCPDTADTRTCGSCRARKS
jgi:hypothetical protein